MNKAQVVTELLKLDPNDQTSIWVTLTLNLLNKGIVEKSTLYTTLNEMR